MFGDFALAPFLQVTNLFNFVSCGSLLYARLHIPGR